MEFKISVMYDIAKVFALPCPGIVVELFFEKDLLSTRWPPVNGTKLSP